MTTPSIPQQRVVLALFLIAISAVVWWQNSDDRFSDAAQKFAMVAVPESVAALDFTNAEASWSRLQFDSKGNLIIDTLTETALADAIALISDVAPEPQLARIDLLLSKQFGAHAGQQVMSLLTLLKNYKKMEQRWWQEKGNNIPPDYAELFQLQDQILGETVAKEMFSEQRRLINLMRASYQINNDTTLTEAEKNRALNSLQNAFQESRPSG
jgi:hypothetical protein